MSARDRFILRYGVLGYGGGLFLLFNLLHIVRLRAHGASLQAILGTAGAEGGDLSAIRLWFRRMAVVAHAVT